MDNIPKIKLLLNNSFFMKILSSEKIINPRRDWDILVISLVIFVLISIGFNLYMYQQIVSGDMYVSVKTTDLVIENLKTDDLQKVLNNFENKKTNTKTLKLENLVDPSI